MWLLEPCNSNKLGLCKSGDKCGGGGGGGIGYQVSDITSTKCSFGYFSLDTPTPFAVLTVFFLDNT